MNAYYVYYICIIYTYTFTIYFIYYKFILKKYINILYILYMHIISKIYYRCIVNMYQSIGGFHRKNPDFVRLAVLSSSNCKRDLTKNNNILPKLTKMAKLTKWKRFIWTHQEIARRRGKSTDVTYSTINSPTNELRTYNE